MRMLRPRSNTVNNFDTNQTQERQYAASILSNQLSCIKSNNDFFYRAGTIGNQYKFISCPQLYINFSWIKLKTQANVTIKKEISMQNGIISIVLFFIIPRNLN